MHRVHYVFGVFVLAVALFLSVVVAGLNSRAAAQEATPVPAEEPTTDAMQAITGTMSMTATVQAVLENIEGAEESLFINLTSDDLNRAAMAVNFANSVLTTRGIPVTIFLNVEGVHLADTTIPQHTHVTGETIQTKLRNFMANGGTVLICPFCMQNVGGMTQADLLEGVLMGSPPLTQGALFADNATVLSY